MAQTRAQSNRQIRQDALREKLEAMGLVQQVTETTEKIANLQGELEPFELQRLKTANEFRLKLINKYLPDLKITELSGEVSATITAIERTVVEAPNSNS